VLRAGFLAREGLSLPLHLVRKPVRALIPKPDGADTENREAVKFEMFIFDAIPLADRSLFFEVDRAEEFAPLKNREGPDSIETCLRGQVEKAARWLETCGIAVPRGDDGRPRSLLEISPLFALDRGELAAKRGALPDRIDADTLLA
jgi:UDP-N-acetylglucosamine/UDP-N-acetylgalactosamine diphosphorylase